MKTTVTRCINCAGSMSVDLNRSYDDKRMLICDECGECDLVEACDVRLLEDQLTWVEKVWASFLVAGCLLIFILIVTGASLALYMFVRDLPN